MKRLLILAAFCASACGGNSTTPSATSAVDFSGVYTGTYQITSCADGSIPGFCNIAGFVPGARLPMNLSIRQNQSSVTGTLTFGSLSGNFQGTATGAGLIGTAAMDNQTLSGFTIVTNVTSWSSTLTGSSITGNFTITFAVAGFSQPATFSASIASLTR